MVKIKLPKKTLWHGIILNPVNKNLETSMLAIKLTPQQKIELGSYPYFAVVKNTLTRALSILTRCDINFLENA